MLKILVDSIILRSDLLVLVLFFIYYFSKYH